MKQLWSLDRFEGETGVLVCPESETLRHVPRAALPKGARSGHMLNETDAGYTIDHAATEALRKEIGTIMDKFRRLQR